MNIELRATQVHCEILALMIGDCGWYRYMECEVCGAKFKVPKPQRYIPTPPIPFADRIKPTRAEIRAHNESLY